MMEGPTIMLGVFIIVVPACCYTPTWWPVFPER